MNNYKQPREIGDNLVLRWTTPQDVERVGALAAMVFRNGPDDPPNARQAGWTRDLGSGRHPLTNAEQGIIVEDTRAGKIVSSLWSIPQVWRYGDISFNVGRPEQVVCDPDYRRRGLVRALFDTFHAHSAAEGQLAQGITGIRYFYRQFGYEYAVDLGGYRDVIFSDIPAAKEGEDEPYRLRPATSADIPFMAGLYERDRQRSMLSADISQGFWEWNIDGVSETSGEGWQAMILEDMTGASCGYVLPRRQRWGGTLGIRSLAVRDGLPLTTVMLPMLRALRGVAQATPAGSTQAVPDRLSFDLGVSHPVYDALGDARTSHREAPYAWYVRVPYLPAFIRHIAPVLERRLLGSAVEGYTGDIKLEFYRGGLYLAFKNGQLQSAENWQPSGWRSDAHGGFPPLVFLQLLFGRRSLDDLRYAYPDVWAKDDADVLLRTLFPVQTSFVMELD